MSRSRARCASTASTARSRAPTSAHGGIDGIAAHLTKTGALLQGAPRIPGETLRDVIGQRRLLARLGERAVQGDVAHAYEFSGPRSIGKRTVAIRLAQTLLCTSEPVVAGGCGICLACRKIEHR